MRKGRVLLLLAAALAAWAAPERVQADLTVDKGYDLFQTVSPGTNFAGDNYKGVPLKTFNFGGTIGVQNVFPTDTIVQRLDDVTAPAGGTGTTDLEILALQLRSVGLVDFTKFGGTGTGRAFITLQSNPPQGGNSGSMDITFDPNATADNQFGTFDSTLNVSFDIRKNGLKGKIVASDTITLTSTDVPWTHVAPPGALLINGVNHFLNGTDDKNDFFASPNEAHFSGGNHKVRTSGVPEPAGLTLLGIGALIVLGHARRRCRTPH